MVDGFVVGFVAGLSVALPLGAVAVLLLREGLEYGRRVAVAAAVGIAVADAIFATLAVTFGPAIGALVSQYQRGLQLVAAGVLAVVAGVGVARTLAQRRRDLVAPQTLVGPEGGSNPSDTAAAVPARTAGGAFVRFLAVTLANPLTVIYFAVVATGVAQVVQGTGQGVLFVLGVLLGSGGWQLTLAVVGGMLGGRISARARWVTSVAGYLLVLLLAGALALGF